MGGTRSVFYDADGNETADEALAVRGLTVEVDDEGYVLREIESWQVDRAALEGDEGELATRPSPERD